MKLLDFTMGALLVAPLALTGCPGDDSMADSGSQSDTGGSTTATTEMSTTTADGSSGGDETATTGEPKTYPDCNDRPEIPAPPVDCSGVDGVLDGSAIIEAGGDPSVLEGIREVTGSIQINGTDLTNLDFMACVEVVGGEINIFDNDMLTDVSGLWSVTEIGTHFVFSENGAVEIFDSLPNVQQIGTADVEGAGNLIMKNNDSLLEVTGFHSLVGVNNNLTIQFNPVLVHIAGLGGIRVIGNLLAITANSELCRGSIVCVGENIVMPAEPRDDWSINANDDSC